MKKTLMSMALGLVFAVVPVAIYAAACPGTITYGGKTCVLVGENCSAKVCVCAYNCGPA
jgi:hypothetical protein